jgi:hypothetical protein
MKEKKLVLIMIDLNPLITLIKLSPFNFLTACMFNYFNNYSIQAESKSAVSKLKIS